MSTWHQELLARVPFAAKIERHRIAVFHHDGAFRAISDICNHKGGPLSEGRLRGEFVTCPWHGWEYSVAARELVQRALDFWKIVDHHRAELDRPMERAGRKAQPLAAAEEAAV